MHSVSAAVGLSHRTDTCHLMHSSGQRSCCKCTGFHGISVLHSWGQQLGVQQFQSNLTLLLRVKIWLPGLSQFQKLVTSLGYSYYSILLRLEYQPDCSIQCRKGHYLWLLLYYEGHNSETDQWKRCTGRDPLLGFHPFSDFICAFLELRIPRSHTGTLAAYHLAYPRCSHHWQHWAAFVSGTED